jgi:hypothetical protein
MRKIFLLFCFASSIVLLTSFNNCTDVILHNSISTDSAYVTFSEINIKCITSKDNNFVVKNEQEYQKLLTDNLSDHPKCQSYKLPDVDFNLNTLVGAITSCAGCAEPDILKKVIKISAEKKYLIQIFITQKDICKINFTRKSWLLLPKIEEDYTVEFIINKK